jgi:hypothetical protein
MADEGSSDDPEVGGTKLLGLFSPPAGADDENERGNLPEEDSTTPAPGCHQSSYDDVDKAHADMEAPAGSVSYMMGLFSTPSNTETPNGLPPLPPGDSTKATDTGPNTNPAIQRPVMERQRTVPRSNCQTVSSSCEQSESTPLLDGSPSSAWHSRDSSLKASLPANSTDATPKTNVRSRKNYSGLDAPSTRTQHIRLPSTQHIRLPSVAMPAIVEIESPRAPQATSGSRLARKALRVLRSCVHEASKPTTCIGSFMYLLYHVVFCLALGSAITRPNSSTSILGLMTKTAAIGTISSAAVYWCLLGSEIPALYPTAVGIILILDSVLILFYHFAPLLLVSYPPHNYC